MTSLHDNLPFTECRICSREYETVFYSCFQVNESMCLLFANALVGTHSERLPEVSQSVSQSVSQIVNTQQGESKQIDMHLPIGHRSPSTLLLLLFS